MSLFSALIFWFFVFGTCNCMLVDVPEDVVQALVRKHTEMTLRLYAMSRFISHSTQITENPKRIYLDALESHIDDLNQSKKNILDRTRELTTVCVSIARILLSTCKNYIEKLKLDVEFRYPGIFLVVRTDTVVNTTTTTTTGTAMHVIQAKKTELTLQIKHISQFIQTIKLPILNKMRVSFLLRGLQKRLLELDWRLEHVNDTDVTVTESINSAEIVVCRIQDGIHHLFRYLGRDAGLMDSYMIFKNQLEQKSGGMGTIHEVGE
jgi:hypothetical protein